MEQKKNNTFSWVLRFATQCKGKMTASVLLAVLGSVCGIVPYFAVSRIVIQICGQNYDLTPIGFWALTALLGYLGSTWFGTVSTILSHRSAFTILKNIRTELTAKLSRVPMGYILDTPSGKFKTLLVDTVEKLELPLAHMIPELTANILVPLLMMVYLFILDWRIALISLITIPIGLACYMGMMKDYAKRYDRVLTAGKNMDGAIVEYIGGIEVIKTFNQSAASYGRYADAVMENEAAKTTWFKQTNSFYVAGISIMPSCLLGVLPLGAYLYIQGSLEAPVFITCMILALGLVKPLIQALQYTDSLAMVDSTVKEITGLLETEEMQRPTERVTLPNSHISFRDVCFGYGDTEVLHQISFDAVPDGMTAIVGPSGSGKSTLLNMLAGLEKPTKGEVIINGVHMEKLNEDGLVKFRRENVGFIFQSFHLIGTMNAVENVALPLSFRGVPKSKRMKIANEMLDLVNLKKHKKHLPNQMSGGQQQRVGVARALVVDPKIIFADEPTGNLDSHTSEEVMRLMQKVVKEQKKTLVMVTHDNHLAEYADRVFHIIDGEIVKIVDNREQGKEESEESGKERKQ